MKRIVWLASFPKSGNTWLRLLLANYLDQYSSDGVAVNELNFGRQASSRVIFDEWSVIESSDLTTDEANLQWPDVYRALAANSSDLVFLKTHQAWVKNQASEPVFPADVTAAVLYIVRDPLDVAASMAPHMNISLRRAVGFMCDNAFVLGGIGIAGGGRFPERVLSWSSHVRSWLDSGLPLVLIRYEDLKTDTEGVFARVMAALESSPDPERIQRAVEHTAFERLQQQERRSGFAERRSERGLFFRGGRIGDGRRVLAAADRQRMLDEHGPTMRRLGYRLDGGIVEDLER